MARESIPDDVRRLILTSIISVPHLEAMLLLRNEPNQAWDSKRLAQRLYISEKGAGELLSELCAAGFAVPTEPETSTYQYHPRSEELREMIDRLAETYTKNLVEVTNLILFHKACGIQSDPGSDPG